MVAIITTRYAAAITCLVAATDAFTPGGSFTTGRASVKSSAFRSSRPLFAGDEPKDGTTITSARKEIGYDAASGRFFETDIDTECLPDENEYCVVDKETGELVSLTLEQKEWIFLAALQVSCVCAVFGLRII